ncbi:MAG TPA: DNA polymerase III subunit delta' [Candidatus Nanopelagicales bacterium]|nr:DNA polymerase III subunit delta' [Candidatus Nanopelagicales bacterium]
MVATPLWSALIGQDEAVATLSAAVSDAAAITRGEPGPAMSHAWLITGPPGSGRSLAATTFAAALVCAEGGCGHCQACRTAEHGGHPDVHVEIPEGSELLLQHVSPLISMAAQAPITSMWRVIVIEDADRLNDHAANHLLKSLEEPTAHTVWILCAPSVEDVLPTIASRVRHVGLRTPRAEDITRMLVESHGVDETIAAFAARAAQGHIGRARALATDPATRERRQQYLRAPMGLRDLSACVFAAGEVFAAATAVAEERADRLDEQEGAFLKDRFYAEGVTRLSGALKRAHDREAKELAQEQKRRRKRLITDEVDRALVDLIGLFRDVLTVQLDAHVELINEEMRAQVEQIAGASTPEQTVRRLEALEHERIVLFAGGSPRTVLEASMVQLKDPEIRAVS